MAEKTRARGAENSANTDNFGEVKQFVFEL